MKRTVIILAICCFLFGCTTAAVLNLNNNSLPSLPNGQQPTMAQVEKAILLAARDRGWKAQVKQPGLIQADLVVREHTASIKIPYTRSDYSIIYLDSANLSFDGENIHKRYNNWVVKLDRSIQKRITELN